MTYLIVTTIITLIYSIIITSFLIGWIKIKKTEEGAGVPSSVFTSVVIAVKNEEQNIPFLLDSLVNQTTHHADYEIIIINDHSTDGTVNLIRNSDHSNLRLLSLPVGQKGKKEALQYGINNSNGELIITTDADCLHHQNWLETVIKFYIQHKPKLIIAPVLMYSKSFFEQIQALDFFSLFASGAGASGIKRPIMCNGANLAFEKKAYNDLHDPHNKSFSSGDDIFLLLNIKQKYREEIMFLKSKEALVYTKSEKTIRKFINQRKRWVSKSTGYRDLDIILVSIVVFFTNLFLAFNLIGSIFFQELLLIFSVQLFLKSIVDFSFLYIILRYYNKKKLLWYFIPTQLLNILLVPYIALSGILASVKWR